MKTFEEYLEEEFAQTYRGLDDEMPEAFNDWLGKLDVQEMIDYVEEWGSELLNNITK